MIRGTNPTIIFTLPFEVSSIQRLWITFSQRNEEVFTLSKDDCEMTDDKVTVTLSQEQTLLLMSNSLLDIQFRVLTINDTALASNILSVPVHRILKGGVI